MPDSFERFARRCRHCFTSIALRGALLACPAAVSAQDEPRPLPTFAELEAAGATIGTIRVVPLDIFDLSDPREDYTIFRWANELHIRTRSGVIEQALLFKSGERVSARLIEENERLLRANRYLQDVQFRPSAVRENVVDVEVLTRDSWSLYPAVGVGRAGGVNSSQFGLREYNLLGTGIAVWMGRSNDVDRSGTGFDLAYPRAFGTWTSIGYTHARNSDGKRNAVSVVRPFYELDARWSAGIRALDDDRVEAIYNTGAIASQYRHREKSAEVFGGWSRGLNEGWTQRWSLGLRLQDDAYASEPNLTPPAELPDDRRHVGPYVLYDLIEERYERELNRNLMGRPEFFALGLAASVQLGYAAPALGSSEEALLYALSLSHGFEAASGQTLVASASLTGQFSDGQVSHQRLGGQAQYYVPQSPRRLFFASLSADTLTRADASEALLLGGDNGLRGYPLRYQSGTRRVLFTAEQRFYTDLYIWRLFRIGGAAFFDIGRAWGGDNVNTTNPGWLSDLGIGLRIVSTRSSNNDVLHVDVAFPRDATPDIEKVQLIVKAKTSF